MTGTRARRHLSVHLDGDAARAVDGLRAVWDPVMHRVAPAHVTVVYPEETVDVRLLLQRAAVAAAETSPFPIRLGAVTAVDGGRGGVLAAIEDLRGGLTSLRDGLLLPPQGFVGYPFHATVAHPRTATSTEECWTRLRGTRLDVAATVRQLVWTVTDDASRTVVERFPLAGPPAAPRTATAAGVLIDGDRLLLGLRRRGRASYPGVWDLPGGHVEPGESPRGALRRELREELGVDVTADGPWRRLVDDDAGIELWIWLVREWRGRVRNLAPQEHERLGWFGAGEFAALRTAHPSYPGVLTDALRSAPRRARSRSRAPSSAPDRHAGP